MKKQFVIILEGPMGAGKTTIASILHPKLPRTALLSMDKIKWFLSDFERNNEDNGLISKVMLSMAKTFLEQGCNVLIEQGFWKKEYVEPYINLANEFRTDLHFYQLEAPIEVLRERAHVRPDTPGKIPLTKERIENNLKTWKENRYDLGKVFDTTEFSSEEVVKFILVDIKK